MALSALIDETLIALDAIRSAIMSCRAGQDGRLSVERGLAAIRESAVESGLEELAETASAWLELVRKDPAGAGTGAADPGQILDFTARAEELLALARVGNVPEGKFFRQPVARGGSRDSGQTSPLDPSIDRILAAAARTPTGGRFEDARIAAIRVSGEIAPPDPGGAPCEGASRPGAGASHAEGALSAGAAGYAFEAALAHETVRNLSIHYKHDPRFCALISNLSEYFGSSSRWVAEARSIPIGEFLREVIAWTEEHAESLGRKLSCEVEGKSFAVLPGVGRLVRSILRTVFRRLLAQDRGKAAATALLSIESNPGYFTLRLSNLPSSFQRTSTKLHLYSIQERVEKVGIVLSQGELGNEVIIDVPENLQSIEVQILRWCDSVIGVPAHRVVSVHEGLQASLIRGDGCVEIQGETMKLVDLTGGGPQERVPPVVVLRNDSSKLGLLVDAVLEKEEMPIQVSSHADWQSELIGICISPGDFRCIPLVRWSLEL